MSVLLYFLLAFLMVAVLIPFIRGKAISVGYVDKPGGRKNHLGNIPPVGGLVIFSIFIVVCLLSGTNLSSFWPLFAGIIILLGVGAVDDILHIRPWIKFFAQSLAAFIIVFFGDIVVFDLGNLFGFGDISMGWLGFLFSWFCVVLLINSINMMDGLDGLAAGKSAIVLLWFIIACYFAGFYAPIKELLILLGAVLAFLYYNMRHPFRDKACIFLGDAGSMSLGLVLGWYSISLSQEPSPVLVPVSVAWIVALPVIDAFALFVYRAKQGRHPFSADRNHFHHHFVHAGIPVSRATPMILVIGFLWGLVGYGGVNIGIAEPVLMYIWIALLFFHTFITIYPERFIKLLSKFGVKNEQ